MKVSACTICTQLSIWAQNSGSDVCSWHTLRKRHNVNTTRLFGLTNSARKNSENRQKNRVWPASCSVEQRTRPESLTCIQQRAPPSGNIVRWRHYLPLQPLGGDHTSSILATVVSWWAAACFLRSAPFWKCDGGPPGGLFANCLDRLIQWTPTNVRVGLQRVWNWPNSQN